MFFFDHSKYKDWILLCTTPYSHALCEVCLYACAVEGKSDVSPWQSLRDLQCFRRYDSRTMPVSCLLGNKAILGAKDNKSWLFPYEHLKRQNAALQPLAPTHAKATITEAFGASVLVKYKTMGCFKELWASFESKCSAFLTVSVLNCLVFWQ